MPTSTCSRSKGIHSSSPTARPRGAHRQLPPSTCPHPRETLCSWPTAACRGFRSSLPHSTGPRLASRGTPPIPCNIGRRFVMPLNKYAHVLLHLYVVLDTYRRTPWTACTRVVPCKPRGRSLIARQPRKMIFYIWHPSQECMHRDVSQGSWALSTKYHLLSRPSAAAFSTAAAAASCTGASYLTRRGAHVELFDKRFVATKTKKLNNLATHADLPSRSVLPIRLAQNMG